MNLVHSNWNNTPFQSTPYYYGQEDILENYETPSIEQYVDSMEKFFQVSTKDEIRKGCRWKISFIFSKTLMKTCPIKRVHVLRRESDLDSIPPSKRDEYFCVLKVRSKLITPKKEVELEKACTILSESLSLRVREDSAHLEVKFTQRPRSLFHKHSDVMILVGTLYYGQKQLFQDTQELVFRGGTGSAHSAAAEKKKRTAVNNNNKPAPVENVPTYCFPTQPLQSMYTMDHYGYRMVTPIQSQYSSPVMATQLGSSSALTNNNQMNQHSMNGSQMTTQCAMNGSPMSTPMNNSQMNGSPMISQTQMNTQMTQHPMNGSPMASQCTMNSGSPMTSQCTMNGSPMGSYTSPLSTTMENIELPLEQMSYPVSPEFSTGYFPTIQESQNRKEEYSQSSPTTSIFGSSEEIINVNDFYNDFLEMQGDYLLSGYNDVFPAPESSISSDIKLETFDEQCSGVNMCNPSTNLPLTMSVDQVRQIDNDRCEACMQDSQLSGTFSGSFNQ